MAKGVVKITPEGFSLYLPNDGLIFMSDIPKCSKVYAGSDATGGVAIA